MHHGLCPGVKPAVASVHAYGRRLDTHMLESMAYLLAEQGGMRFVGGRGEAQGDMPVTFVTVRRVLQGWGRCRRQLLVVDAAKRIAEFAGVMAIDSAVDECIHVAIAPGN
ncbi:hypothetical protein D3C78_1243820 [compost metagenome]